MKNYLICKKLNYDREKIETQEKVNRISSLIRKKMNLLGYIESNENETEIDYVFSVGGDGTMLYSMHTNIDKNSTIIGINAGNVGFLTPFDIEDIESGNLFNYIKNKSTQRVEYRSVLQHSLIGKDKREGIAVNEYAITAEKPNDMLEFSIEIEYRNHLSKAGNYKANAVIVSGPCGSTAYNMNAGGAIVDPSVKCMQIVMIAPTTLGSRPLVLGQNTKIYIKPLNAYKVYADGILYFEGTAEEASGLKISLKEDESSILVPDNFNFYKMLSKKLHWNNGKEV